MYEESLARLMLEKMNRHSGHRSCLKLAGEKGMGPKFPGYSNCRAAWSSQTNGEEDQATQRLLSDDPLVGFNSAVSKMAQ